MAAEPAQWVRKLPRLWGLYARMDLLWMTRDFRFFVICMVSDRIIDLAGVLAVFLLAERFEGIGDWSKTQIVFMLGYSTAVTGAMQALFNFNVLHISRRIGRGQLDHTLIQPQPLWLSLLTEGFMPFSGSGTLVIGFGLAGWAAWSLSLAGDTLWWLAVVVQWVSSCVVYVAYMFLWGSLAFWAPYAAEEVNSSSNRFLADLRTFPLDGVGGLLAGGLITIVPVGLVAWYPSRWLLGLDVSAVAPWVTPCAGVVLALLALAAFWKGIRHYERTGSRRYTDFGHRS